MGDLFLVPGKVGGREDVLGEMEAGPGPPGSQGGIRARDARGEVLEMAHRIAEEEAGIAIEEEPDEGWERRGDAGDKGSLVELEDGLGRLALLPEGLGQLETGLMEGGAALPAMLPGV